MSGICGIVNFDGASVDPELLKKMAEAAAHRGPDGIRYLINGNVGLAHLALNATPESLRERQPLLSTDGLVCLTADARVDNRDDLIRTLTAKGYLLAKDPTDADLILAAYQCWGKTCPEHIIGDFAFAVWDGHKQRLFCARDALGVKPLHYGQMGQIVCIASEAQQIIQHPAIPRRLDEVAMADHLVNNCYDEERTIFLDVRRLPPASRFIVSQAGVHLERYWDVDPEARTVYQDDDDYVVHFLELFRRAVTDRLRTPADVIGIAMSGGLDSCSVAAIAQQTLARPGGTVTLAAYSYAFDRLRECDERVYSRAMADELGVEIEYISAERFWFLDDPVAFRPDRETPFMGWESIGRHCLGLLSERGARGVLTGHGGDSLLEGSRLVYVDRLLSGRLSVLWELADRAREMGLPYRRLAYAYVLLGTDIAKSLLPYPIVRGVQRLMGHNSGSQIPEWIAPDFAYRINLVERVARAPIRRRFRSLAQQANYERVAVLGSVARAVYWYDRVASAFGLEPRHPFLDRRLVEFTMSIPPAQTFQAGRGRKLILRRAMEGVLPEVIRLRQGKTTFESYLACGLQEKETGQICAIFQTPLLGKMGIVDPKRLRRAYNQYLAGEREREGCMLRSAVSLELWLRQYCTLSGDGSHGKAIHTGLVSANPAVRNGSSFPSS